jgi:hypothetical protein
MLIELVVNSYIFCGYTTYYSCLADRPIMVESSDRKSKIPKSVGGGRSGCLVYFVTDRISEVEFQSHLQRILYMYIGVEPYLYDTSQVKYINSVLLHSNVYVLSCLFSRNLSVSFKRREALSARNLKSTENSFYHP